MYPLKLVLDAKNTCLFKYIKIQFNIFYKDADFRKWASPTNMAKLLVLGISRISKKISGKKLRNLEKNISRFIVFELEIL
jgi:hypothetical protein